MSRRKPYNALYRCYSSFLPARRSQILNTARVKHNTDTSANGLGRQVTSKSATNDTVTSVVSADFAPVDAKGTIGGLGDKGYLFTQIEIHILLTVASLDLDKGDRVVLVAETAFVTENGAVHVKARGPFFSSHGLS
jgi:hypothetical protein